MSTSLYVCFCLCVCVGMCAIVFEPTANAKSTRKLRTDVQQLAGAFVSASWCVCVLVSLFVADMLHPIFMMRSHIEWLLVGLCSNVCASMADKVAETQTTQFVTHYSLTCQCSAFFHHTHSVIPLDGHFLHKLTAFDI